jgi:hypothetical protein
VANVIKDIPEQFLQGDLIIPKIFFFKVQELSFSRSSEFGTMINSDIGI